MTKMEIGEKKHFGSIAVESACIDVTANRIEIRI